MEKIDFVLPWVDGADLQWQAEKKQYEAVESGAAKGEANDTCRYRDFGLLRYWFRSIERFAPWVNNIYLVTCGQKPDWLDESNPKLRLVNHRDYIPQEYLPTFNSNTIELNLFRLNDLSEHFVLFNDDTFILRPLPPEFFFENGNPVLPCNLAIPRWLGYNNASRVIINNSGILNYSMNVERQVWKNWKKFFSIRQLGLLRAVKNLLAISVNRAVIFGSFGHLPQPHLKSTLAELWDKKADIMDGVSHRRFRSDDCINHWLACGWNMLNGRFSPAQAKQRGISLYVDGKSVDMVCKTITGQSCPEICINDTKDCEDIFALFEKVSNAFEQLLPDKSSFEK